MALLWYDLFTNHLKEKGFVLNPYDPCITNSMINGKQCTIIWHIDNNKISHVKSSKVMEIIGMIEEHFGKMTMTHGDRHTFLGMDIYFTGQGTVEILMTDYLQEAIVESGMNITCTVATPATRNLFKVSEQATVLGKEQVETFHSVAAKLLYIAICACMDILLPIIFLCTPMSKSTVKDQCKLK